MSLSIAEFIKVLKEFSIFSSSIWNLIYINEKDMRAT